MIVVFAVQTKHAGRAVRGQIGSRMMRNLAAGRRLVRHDAIVAGRVPDVILVRMRILLQIRLMIGRMKVSRIEIGLMVKVRLV